ncbi:MAG: bifunctional diguanylate cyclase/phosphodiesterase [Selenomonadaceae bacterium]|nr:bifunctional diguanylate cyclase/phosphodiesterase [Selenomonadaceae bacterium]
MNQEEHRREQSWQKRKLIVLTILFVMLQASLLYAEANMMHAGRPIIVAGHAFTPFAIPGILAALKAIVCALLTVTDYRIGGRISLAVIILDILRMVVGLVMGGSLGIIVGLTNQIMLFVIICIIQSYMKRVSTRSITDDLTGLRNRRGLMIDLVRRGEKRDPFTLIYLDLDNFKYINDTYGHPAGDRVLQEVAGRWQAILPKGTELFRMGGDEFVAIFPHDGGPAALKEAETLTGKLVTCIGSKQFDHDKSPVDKYLTVSAGIVSYPQNAPRTDLLIGYADVAMYQAKRTGKNKYYVFDEDMGRKIQRELEMEAHIREGLDKNLFYLVYQPQFTSEGKRLRGFESLLRLKTENGEFISPGEFIPVAEKTDLIIEIDRMVLRRALREFHDAVTAPGSQLMISVNISSRHVTEPDFVDEIRAALAECSFPANHLELEITEYSMIENVDKVVETLNELKAMGVEIAMDDFGSGYASLSWLAKMPIDLLKLDKSLVDDIAGSPKNTEFVNLIIAMGHLLGANVVAEGVEHETQKEILKEKECNYIQGFLWSKPLEYSKALECVAADRKLDES